MINPYEQRFMNVVFEIMNNGFYQKNERTGIATKRIPHAIIAVDCEKEIPILHSKKTEWKSSVEEMFWIFRDGSNDIHDLRPKIWDSWADENGIVQKTYGYQIRRFDQVNRVLNDLSRDSSTRRAVIDLWNCEDLPEMSITPCVYTSTWNIIDGKLNAMVTSRSCDILVGGVFNIFQYYTMLHLFARHLGVKPGLLTFSAADCHIYENQFDECRRMMRQYHIMLSVGRGRDCGYEINTNDDLINYIEEQIKFEEYSFEEFKKTDEYSKMIAEGLSPNSVPTNLSVFLTLRDTYNEILTRKPDLDIVKAYDSTPTFIIDDGKRNFFDMKIEDIHLEDYYSMPFIKFPVAV